MIAAVAYFSMGANLGWTGIAVEFRRSSPKVAGNVRQIFYVRYIDCMCTFPELLHNRALTKCRVPHYAAVAPRSSLDIWAANTNYMLHNSDQ
jgi:bacteriorhodopsin